MMIAIIFIILVALILWLLVENKINWAIKAAITSICFLFGIITYQSMDNFSGLATTSPLPEKFIIHWAVILKSPEDPNIYLWITDITREDNNIEFKVQRRPKVYKMPYSDELRDELLSGVMSKLKKGKKVVGENKRKKGSKDDDKNYYSSAEKIELKFYDLPPALMPPK